MTNNKKTALELFAIALYEKGLLIGNGDWMQNVLEEFKGIEKEQMIGFAIEYTYGTKKVGESLKEDFIKLYKQTYGGGEQ
jgi:fucose permease